MHADCSRRGSQMMAASCSWEHVITGLLLHEKRDPSSPVHSSWVRWTGPAPTPKVLSLPEIALLPADQMC